MPPFDITAGLAKRDASGQLLPSGVTGPELLNFRDTVVKNTIGNITSSDIDDLPDNQGIRGKNNATTLKYPIEDANPAYQARVTFRMYSLQPKNPADTQKLLKKQTEDNLKNLGATAAHSEDTTFANMGKKVGPTTVASAAADEFSGGNIKGGEFGAAVHGGASTVKTESQKLDESKKDQSEILTAIGRALKGGFSFQPVKNSTIVDMYFPLSMQFLDTVQYGTANLNASGAAISAAVESGAGALEATLNSISQAGEQIFDLITGNPRLGEAAARLATSRLINSKLLPAPQGVRTALTLTNRSIINPNVRSLFQGVALREFTFQFKMIAESKQEALQVEQIIKHFRKELYPATYSLPLGSTGVEADVGYKFPNVFQIVFNYKGSRNKSLPKLHHCYLRSVSHTVNPTGGGFRRDGHPNEIDLTLAFVEYKTLSKKDIDKGY